MITLRPLSDENRATIVGLRLAAGQDRFVNTVEEALPEAEEEPGAGRSSGACTTKRRPSAS